jgi:hypothetical protein
MRRNENAGEGSNDGALRLDFDRRVMLSAPDSWF